MDKAYNEIIFHNDQSPDLDEENMNAISHGLAVVDDRVIQLKGDLTAVINDLDTLMNDAFIYKRGVNAFDVNTITREEKITGTGYVEGFYPTQHDVSWYTSDYIPVNSGDVIIFNRVRRCLGYTNNDVHSATVSLVWESLLSQKTITITEDIKFIRFGALQSELDGTMVTINDEMPSQYEPYGKGFEVTSIKAEMLPNEGNVSYSSIKHINKNVFDTKNLTVFGNATFNNGIITVKGANGGVQTPFFTANEKVEVYLNANITVSSERVQLAYKKSNGTIVYTVVGRLMPADEFIKLSVDLPYYSVYEDAQEFSFVLNTGDSSGTITINDFYVRYFDSIEQTSFYDSEFEKMMINIDDKINDISGPENGAIFIGNPDGKKYKLQIGDNGALITVPTIPTNVLFTGNSLLRGFHDETNNSYFGMCASDYTKDYYFKVSQAIKANNPSAIINKSSCVGLEQAETTQAQESWVNGQISAGFINPNLDLIIIQIGDNVNNNNRKNTFVNGFGNIVKTIRNTSPNARIILVGAWFVSYTEIITTMKKVAENYGCEFVNISALNTVENQGYHGQIITWSDGSTTVASDNFITHPGDKGFAKIGDKLIEVLKM